MENTQQDLLFRIAISNPLFTLRIIEGDESYEYWLDRLMDTTTAQEFDQQSQPN